MRLAQPLLKPTISRSLASGAYMALIGLQLGIAPLACANSALGYGDAVLNEATDSGISRSAPARIETFRGLDKNRDGFVSRTEMRGSPRFSVWRAIDRNHDGKLSAREYSDFRAHREHSTKFDSVGAAEQTDYGDPYLNSRLGRNSTTLKKGPSEAGLESESHYEEVLRKSNLERERRKNPAGY